MPIYHILFRLKPISSEFSMLYSGHMMKCLLSEFGWKRWENIWLLVMTLSQLFLVSPPTQSISAYCNQCAVYENRMVMMIILIMSVILTMVIQ